MPKLLTYFFAAKRRRHPVAPQREREPVRLSHAEIRSRNYHEMHQAALAKERRLIDGR